MVAQFRIKRNAHDHHRILPSDGFWTGTPRTLLYLLNRQDGAGAGRVACGTTIGQDGGR